jgi:hypothetical protein
MLTHHCDTPPGGLTGRLLELVLAREPAVLAGLVQFVAKQLTRTRRPIVA